MELEHVKHFRLKTAAIKAGNEKTEKKKEQGKMQGKKVSQIESASSHINHLSKKIHARKS